MAVTGKRLGQIDFGRASINIFNRRGSINNHRRYIDGQKHYKEKARRNRKALKKGGARGGDPPNDPLSTSGGEDENGAGVDNHAAESAVAAAPDARDGSESESESEADEGGDGNRSYVSLPDDDDGNESEDSVVSRQSAGHSDDHNDGNSTSEGEITLNLAKAK